MEQILKDYFTDCLQTINNIVIYKGIKENPVMRKFTEYIEYALDHNSIMRAGGIRSEFLSMLISEAESSLFIGNIFKKFVIKLFLKDENIFSLSLEKALSGSNASLYNILLSDMDAFKTMMDIDIEMILQNSRMSQAVISYTPLTEYSCNNILNEYIDILANISDKEKLAETLSQYYNSFGCGNIGIYKMFRYTREGAVLPIKNSDGILLNDIIGYDEQKKALISNTEAFLVGCPCNNALLVGARGTGKSSLVKALVNEYFDRGLRLLELSKDQLANLPDILNILKKRGKRFIIFLDDLSFDEFEIQYKYLKSLLEGSAEVRPKNVIFYATSNRRHIIREKWADKDGTAINDGEIHVSDTVNEKLSLADRFGTTIVFHKPSPAEYMEIVKGIAKKEGLELQEDFLKAEAMKWEINQKGLSGRTARQFINSLHCPERNIYG